MSEPGAHTKGAFYFVVSFGVLQPLVVCLASKHLAAVHGCYGSRNNRAGGFGAALNLRNDPF